MRGKRIFAMATLAVVFASLFAIPAPVLAQEEPRMYIDPSSLSVDMLSTFTVSVWVENVYDMYAYEFKVRYDARYLTFIAPPTEGPFLETGGDTYFAWFFNPQTGVQVGATLIGERPGVEGTGKIAELTFRAEVAGAAYGKAVTLDLYDEKKLDSYLQPIPELPPGDSAVTIKWWTWLLNTEFYLSAEKGGKIWTEWQTANLIGNEELDPNSPIYDPSVGWLDYFSGYPLMWPKQMIYSRIRNLGSEPAGDHVLYVRSRNVQFSTSIGWAQAAASMPERAAADSEVITTAKVGPVDLYNGIFNPYEDFQQYPSFWGVYGRIEISLDAYNFFRWDQILVGGQRLPGDWYSKNVPGGSSGKFKVLHTWITTYDLTIGHVGFGTVGSHLGGYGLMPVEGTYTYAAGARPDFIAWPGFLPWDVVPTDPNWKLDHWELDGVTVVPDSKGRVFVDIDADHVLTAFFVPTAP